MSSLPSDSSKAVGTSKLENSMETETMIVETSKNLEPATADSNPAAQRDSLVGLTAGLEKKLVQIFKLFSDETRLRILMFLAREKELHVSALCERLGQSQPAVSHHLALLRVAGLVEARRDGKHNFYSVCREHFQMVLGILMDEIADPETKEFKFEEFAISRRS